MNVAPRTVLSLCSGAGGLDLGLRVALPGARTVLYVEREAHAAAVLAARMEEDWLDPAPVWSDLKTFDYRRLRGRVDLVVGGIPCQPFSTAGRRAGTDDDRWLWPDFWRAVRETGARFIFLENVPGLLARGFGDILRDLAAAGWSAEWDVFSAAEVGAPHRRERVFLLANSESGGVEGGLRTEAGQGMDAGLAHAANGTVAHDDSDGREWGAESYVGPKSGLAAPGRDHPERRHTDVVDAGCIGNGADQPEPIAGCSRTADAGTPGAAVADARNRQLPLAVRPEEGRDGAGSAGAELEHAHNARLPDAQLGGVAGAAEGERQAHSATVESGRPSVGHATCDGRRQGRAESAVDGGRGATVGASGHFPPGPGDLDGWHEWLRRAPGTQPAIRRGTDGLAGSVDVCLCSRRDRLRAIGNGVVPLTAALAFRTLWRRLMEGQ